MKNAVIIICTRKESSRLPGKAFLPVAGVPAIEHILRRIEPAGIRTILAVPYGQRKDYFKFVENRKNWASVYEGEADSPLHRMAAVVQMQDPKPDFIVRITHDDILIDSKTLVELLEKVDKEDAGYGIAPGILDAAGVEVISRGNLIEAAKKHAEPVEFVSWYVRGDIYNPKVVRMEPRPGIKRDYRLTMDYPEDAKVLDIVLRSVGSAATVDSICAFLDKNQALLNINKIPLVSVYTPALNVGPWIKDALLSVLSDQDMDSLEHIVVDSGSTDDSLVQVASFAGDHRLRILLNEGTRLTCAEASNRAIKAARGKFVLRLDADDTLKTGALEKMVSAIGDKMVLYSAYHEMKEAGGVFGAKKAPNPELAGCALMRRDFITHVGFGDVKHHDGLELFTRIRDKFPIGYLNESLWNYRVRQSSHSRKPENQEEREKIKARILEGAEA